MRRATMLWGAFMTRFVDAQARYRRRGLTAEEAGELLGVSGRHFRRLCVRYDDEGVDGLRDRRLGRVSLSGRASPRAREPNSAACATPRERSAASFSRNRAMMSCRSMIPW